MLTKSWNVQWKIWVLLVSGKLNGSWRGRCLRIPCLDCNNSFYILFKSGIWQSVCFGKGQNWVTLSLAIWPLWTSLAVASGHPTETRPNRHIWLVPQDRPKGGKYQNKKVLLTCPSFPSGMLQDCHFDHLYSWSIWSQTTHSAEVAIYIRMAVSGIRAPRGWSIKMLPPALFWASTFWAASGTIWWDPSDHYHCLTAGWIKSYKQTICLYSQYAYFSSGQILFHRTYSKILLNWFNLCRWEKMKMQCVYSFFVQYYSIN